MNLDNLPFNAFDFIFVAILVFGISCGRKWGMSGELISVIAWLAVIFGCALAYEPLATLFSDRTALFSTLTCYIMAYVGAAIVILLICAGLKRVVVGKLIGSD